MEPSSTASYVTALRLVLREILSLQGRFSVKGFVKDIIVRRTEPMQGSKCPATYKIVFRNMLFIEEPLLQC